MGLDPHKNDEIREFRVGRPISSKEMTYQSPKDALYSPLAKKLFGFPWTEEVAIGPDFVRVKKASWVDWDVLASPLEGLIREHVEKAGAVAEAKGHSVEENQEPPSAPDLKDPKAQTIQEHLETHLNPSLAQHGGRVRLVELREDRAYVAFEGGCQGCAMSQATLKEGVETSILQAFPNVREVIDITDHLSGESPYYTS